MKHFIDGDQFCIVRDDFVNLQESPAYFHPVRSPLGDTLLREEKLVALPVWFLRKVDEDLKRHEIRRAIEEG